MKFASLHSSVKFARSEDVLNFIDFRLYLTVFLFSSDTIWKLRMLWIFSQNTKELSIIGELRPWIILKTFVIKTCQFLGCKVICLFDFNKSSKLLFLSLVTILKDVSWILLIRLFDFLKQNIQIVIRLVIRAVTKLRFNTLWTLALYSNQ